MAALLGCCEMFKLRMTSYVPINVTGHTSCAGYLLQGWNMSTDVVFERCNVRGGARKVHSSGSYLLRPSEMFHHPDLSWLSAVASRKLRKLGVVN